MNHESVGDKPGGDGVEIKAIGKVFRPERTYVNSTKSFEGHTFGAAGAVEAIRCILAVRQRLIPPSIKLVNPIPEVLGYFGDTWKQQMSPNEATEAEIEVAVNDSFGFGGNNAITIWARP
jgi:3-oxoacyl-[acyl-carrier-protein] synthase II